MIIKIVKNIIKKIRIKTNKLGSKKRSKRLKNNYTLISNNCWGGLTYEYLNQEFISPTIGLYFFSKDYLKFISNLKYYLSLELSFIDTKDSIYYEYLCKINQENVIIGKLDNVEIVFLHYKTKEEAFYKWEKRKNKVNYDRIVYKFNDQNLCTEDDLICFNNLDLKNKICFTAKEYNYPNFIYMRKYQGMDYVKDDAYSYHKYLDIIDYLNNL